MAETLGPTPEESTGGPFLERLLGLPLFAKLDDTLRKAIAFEATPGPGGGVAVAGSPPRPGYVRFERFLQGAPIVRQGELTTELCIVLDGLAVGVRTDALTRASDIVDHYAPGDWFGEVSALSNVPSLATVRAESPSVIAAIDHRLFRRIFREDAVEEGVFSQTIERRYRERYLALHLQVAPLFASIRSDARRLDEIRRSAEFLRLDAGETVCSEGDDAHAFFLVRAGAIAAFRAGDPHRRPIAYYRANSSFGEQAAATEDRRWPCSLETIAPSDLVAIPREAFERLRAADPEAHRAVTRRANLIVAERALDEIYGKAGSRDDERLEEDEIEVMVARQSAKGGRALVIDKTKCIRCNACVESCAAVHGDGVPRLSKVGTRIATNQVLITACYNCAVPECMAACDYGAIRRDAQGMVRFVWDNCVGCTACTKACPYGVIRMLDPEREELAAQRPRWLESLLGAIPGLGALVARREPKVPAAGGAGAGATWNVANTGGEEVAVKAKTVKCDSCAGLPFEACVYNCPTSAIERRAPEDLFATRRA